MVLKKKSENIYEIEKEKRMNVPGIILASDKLIKSIESDGRTIQQVKNVAMLPGIVKKSLAMPDAHMGYGFCIGGVAAFDIKKGVISPGGVGYDINCGVRLLSTNLKKRAFLKKRKEITHDIKRAVPSGVGRRGNVHLNEKEVDQVLEKGVNWAVEKDYALSEDLERIEDSGSIKGADASKVSAKAKGRGRNQLGTLGAGNHFLEIQIVEEVFDKKIAEVFGLEEGQVTVMIHCGSRGLGHQTASDYIKKFEAEYGIKHLPDRELISAPIDSPLGRDYTSAMAAAANFAFSNRQLITYQIRKVFKRHFPKSKLDIVYDIAHNMAKFEDHKVEGKKRHLCVHRKGATRSFGPGRDEIPKLYRKTGLPIFIPGSMGTSSYVLVGTKKAEEVSFGSTAHGAGRVMSRKEASQIPLERVKKQLQERDVYIESDSKRGMTEEAPEAYKDVDEVVKVSHELGIGNLVAKLKPLAVIKG